MIDTILYFGSFNPVHRGHTAIAQWVAGRGYGDVWLVVSPRNPLKNSELLAPDEDRLRMVELALEGVDGVGVCDVEFSLPKPSYTIDTLRILRDRFADRRFSLLVGADILPELERWKEYGRILDEFRVLVYPRAGVDVAQQVFVDRVTMLPSDAPLFEFSSTEVRERLAHGEDCSAMADPKVLEYIALHGLYVDHLACGKELFRQSEFGAALNEFRAVDSPEAREYIAHIQEIFEFRNTDIYNP